MPLCLFTEAPKLPQGSLLSGTHTANSLHKTKEEEEREEKYYEGEDDEDQTLCKDEEKQTLGWFESQPDDVILHVLRFLCVLDLCETRRVNKVWCMLASHNRIWREKFGRRWHIQTPLTLTPLLPRSERGRATGRDRAEETERLNLTEGDGVTDRMTRRNRVRRVSQEMDSERGSLNGSKRYHGGRERETANSWFDKYTNAFHTEIMRPQNNFTEWLKSHWLSLLLLFLSPSFIPLTYIAHILTDTYLREWGGTTHLVSLAYSHYYSLDGLPDALNSDTMPFSCLLLCIPIILSVGIDLFVFWLASVAFTGTMISVCVVRLLEGRCPRLPKDIESGDMLRPHVLTLVVPAATLLAVTCVAVRDTCITNMERRRIRRLLLLKT